MPQLPSVLDYLDIKKFMEDWIQYKKSQKKSTSYRMLSKKAGFKSPNYLQLIIQGKKKLSPLSAEQVAKAFQLDDGQSAYFQALVGLENEPEGLNRSAHFSKLLKWRWEARRQVPQSRDFGMLEDWCHSLVMEAFHHFPKGAYPQTMLPYFKGHITLEKIEQSFLVLASLGMISATDEGFILQRPTELHFAKSQGPQQVRQFHLKNLKAQTTLLEQLGLDESFIRVANINLSASQVSQLKEKIIDLIATTCAQPPPTEEPIQLLQLGIFLLPQMNTPSCQGVFP